MKQISTHLPSEKQNVISFWPAFFALARTHASPLYVSTPFALALSRCSSIVGSSMYWENVINGCVYRYFLKGLSVVCMSAFVCVYVCVRLCVCVL